MEADKNDVKGDNLTFSLNFATISILSKSGNFDPQKYFLLSM